MPIRNPFRKAAENDENARPVANRAADKSFQKIDVVGSKPVNISPKEDAQPSEYKLCEINDSGVYLPPSPPEKKGFWHARSNGSTTSSNHRSMLSETEPFNISRESFDSYRRSFDISARSPIPDLDNNRPRQSLDSRRLPLPRRSINEPRNDRPRATAEEGFEDVGLNDEVQPKKRSLFSRFADSDDTPAQSNGQSDSRPSSSHRSFHLPGFTGRKRGQSGQGQELGNVNTIRSPAPEIRAENA